MFRIRAAQIQEQGSKRIKGGWPSPDREVASCAPYIMALSALRIIIIRALAPSLLGSLPLERKAQLWGWVFHFVPAPSSIA